MSRRPSARMIDGALHELALWLVVEERPDGIPIQLRLCQDDEMIGEVAESTVDDRKTKFQLMWTPRKWLRRRQ